MTNELVHYGVKGMHWGVRKNTPTNSNYSRGQRAYDRNNFGKGGMKRVNRRMNKGQDIAVARKNEVKFRRRLGSAITTAGLASRYHKEIRVGAQVAKTLVGLAAGVAVQHIAKKAETNRGRSSAAGSMGLPRHASSGPTYNKANRKGVYNITHI